MSIRSSFLTLSVLLLLVINQQILVNCAEDTQKYNTYSINTRQYKGGNDLRTIPDDIPLNDESKKTATTEMHHDNIEHQTNEIPLYMIERMNELQNVSQFFNEFVDKDSMDPADVLYAEMGNEHQQLERGSATIPKPAVCTPQDTVVSLIPTSGIDPTLMYYPTCTRVKRCSGCCLDSKLECQPTEVETKNFQINILKYTGKSKLSPTNKLPVFVEVHNKCRCNCRVKPSDCTKYQRHENCQCVCINISDRDKCLHDDNGKKIWNEEKCICQCREEKDCTTGTSWDGNTCSCVESTGLLNPKNTKQIIDRSRFIIRPKPIAQTEDTKYDTKGLS